MVAREFRCNAAGDLWGARGSEFESRHADQSTQGATAIEAVAPFFMPQCGQHSSRLSPSALGVGRSSGLKLRYPENAAVMLAT